MFTFFNLIISFVITIVNFVVNFFGMLVSVVTNIARAVAWLFICIGYLPPWLIAFVTVPISLAIIFQILNKGS